MLTALMLLAAAQQTGPTLPPHATAEIHRVNLQVQRLLSESKFDEAEASLDQWSTRITYAFESPPPEYFAGSIEEAVTLWEDASGGKLSFAEDRDKASVTFRFIPGAAAGDPLPKLQDGRWIAEIPITFGSQRSPMPTRSGSALMAKAFGVAFGLAPTNTRMRVMGVQQHSANSLEGMPFTLDSSELRTLLALLRAREELAGYVERRVAIALAAPKLVIEVDSQDAGIADRGDRVEFEFTLRNAGNAPLMLTPESTCVCVVTGQLRPIEPGEAFTLDTALLTTEFEGLLDKVLILHTNDPEKQAHNLRMKVVSMPHYRVLPEFGEILHLNDEGPTEIELIVYPAAGNPLQVISADVSSNHMKSEVLPWIGEVTDPMFGPEPRRRLGYKINVTFAEQFPQGMDAVRVVILTDSTRQRYHTATIQVQKGIAAQPKNVWFGMPAAGQTLSREVTLSYHHEPFAIKAIVVEGEPFDFKWEPSDERATEHVIVFEAKGDQPGTFQGKAIISTDSPRYPRIEIPLSVVIQ